jgi:hypothetical protein
VKTADIRLVGYVDPGPGAFAVPINPLVHRTVIGGRKPECVPGYLALLIITFLEPDLALGGQLVERIDGLRRHDSDLGTFGKKPLYFA